LVAHNRRSAKSHSGIWRDLAVRKRHTEVDAQLGIVVALGSEAGVPAPLTARLVALIHEIERGERQQSLETLNALANAEPRTPNDEPGTPNDEPRTTNLFP
jgi:2-dehydropantoate 2-reductase